MFMRILFLSISGFLCLGCVKEESPGNPNEVSIELRTSVFSVYYNISEDDRVSETITYDPDFFEPLDEIVLATRQYTVSGAYDKLVIQAGWADYVRSAPGKINQYSGIQYDPVSRRGITQPRLTSWAQNNEGLASSHLPIPTAGDPRNGLDRSWASERAWMGQMVGQFLDVVGPPKLNAEDYVNRVPEARRNQLPLKLNFSDYR